MKDRPPIHRGHLATTIVSLVLVVLALFAIVLGFGVKDRSRDALQAAAVQAAHAVSDAPSPSCNPPVGAGTLGACAPTQAFAATDAVARAAGDPDTITGHPLGEDVSSYQGCSINWKAEGVSFAFVKATEGTVYTDPCLRANVAALKASGLPYGVYDFLRPGTTSNATAEAAYFVNAVLAADANTSLPPVADVEVNAGLSPAQMQAYVSTWESYVAAHLQRTVVLTYTGAWFWTPQVGGKAQGDLWVSGYASSVTVPASWTNWTFWQYSDGTYGPSPHLGPWDDDVFSGTAAQLKALVTTTFVGYKAPAKVTKPAKVTTPSTSPVSVEATTTKAAKPKPTTALAIVVGPSGHKPKFRAGYTRKGLGNGWWEYKPDRLVTVKGAILAGRFGKRPVTRNGFRIVGLGAGWWEYIHA